jgi:hypothetical protein
MRDYVDPRSNRLENLLNSASLTWTATPLTTAKFYSDTSIGETTLARVSGVLTHVYTVELDHDFRRWLTAIGKFTWGTRLSGQWTKRQDLHALRRPHLRDGCACCGSAAPHLFLPLAPEVDARTG